MAIQSGGHAARQILARLEGRPTTPFAYKDKGIMATIGRRAAITQFRSGRVRPGHARLAGLAGPPPRLPGRLPQQDRRLHQLVVALPVVGFRAPHHRERGDGAVGSTTATDATRPEAADPPPTAPAGAVGTGGTVERMESPLEQIDRKVLQLFALVGDSVSGATHALLAGDREAAKALADRDEVVDSLCHDIEELTLQQLTVAGITSPNQLRYLVTVIRMLPDLERNGDLAEHVARRAARGPRRRAVGPQPGPARADGRGGRAHVAGHHRRLRRARSPAAGRWSTTSTTRWTTCT